MLLMSRNLMQYDIVPETATIRINLAWEQSLHQLSQHLDGIEHDIFLDVPCNRKKPPHNVYSPQSIIEVTQRYPNIKYIAISQVEEIDDIMWWVENVPVGVKVVPKIESMAGCKNILYITSVLTKPMIMLDHDDLFQDLCQGGNRETLYTLWIDPLLEICNVHSIEVLRTAGIVFLSESQRST